ncbi:hypothetical protein PsYK624_168210 [Phanerochaete sordida]|uniref:Uncharacterized protein n=1 Tax=Phanerochaete sordida TaxID=48140 RepID=A0A9P3LM75_9APHY|nr:hypothetical protein PsYK624_168210 [Phanerochaete sordida]
MCRISLAPSFSSFMKTSLLQNTSPPFSGYMPRRQMSSTSVDVQLPQLPRSCAVVGFHPLATPSFSLQRSSLESDAPRPRSRSSSNTFGAPTTSSHRELASPPTHSPNSLADIGARTRTRQRPPSLSARQPTWTSDFCRDQLRYRYVRRASSRVSTGTGADTADMYEATFGVSFAAAL